MAENPVMIDQDPRDADWLRQLPPDIDTEEKLFSWLAERGWALQFFLSLPMAERAIEEGRTWIEDLKEVGR